MTEFLESVDWVFEFLYLDVSQHYDRFVDIIHQLIDVYVPLRRTGKTKLLQSPTKPPKAIRTRRWNAWQNYKDIQSRYRSNSSNVVRAWSDFVETNCDCKSFSVSLQLKYEMSLIDQLRSSPKWLHSYINHRRVGRSNLGPLVVQTFASIFHDVEPSDPVPNQLCYGIIHEVEINQDMVEVILKALDANTSVGSES